MVDLGTTEVRSALRHAQVRVALDPQARSKFRVDEPSFLALANVPPPSSLGPQMEQTPTANPKYEP